MGEAEKEAQGRPVEAREHGNNPDTVRRHRRGDAGVEGDIEGSAQGRTATGRRDTADRGETGGREQSGARREAGGAGEDGGGGHGRSMERSDKILMSGCSS